MNNIIKIFDNEFKKFNNYLSKHVHLLLCFFLILISIHFLAFKRPFVRQEGFDVNKGFSDIQKSLNTVKDFADKIPGELKGLGSKVDGATTTITTGVNKASDTVKTNISKGVGDIQSTSANLTSEIDTKLSKFLKEVERVTNEAVIEKLKGFFGQIKNILDMAIVRPFKTLFLGIGNIFFSIFNILKLIGDKIVGLPGCVPAYMMYGTINGVSKFLRSFLPNFLANALSFIYKYTINVIFNWTGINAWMNKCIQFNVDKEVDSMNGTFKEISNTFRDSFGNIPPIKF